jgi:hypothetical protein
LKNKALIELFNTLYSVLKALWYLIPMRMCIKYATFIQGKTLKKTDIV